MNKIKIGVIGCGNISRVYLKNCTELFDMLDVSAVADILPDRAKKRAEEFNIPKACSVEDLLADEDIGIVLNLTIPKAHTEINMAALKAGKNVYVEKPLAITREEGLKVLELAGEKGLMVGAAPDTFMGAGIQTCRKLIDDGWIGRPVAATAFLMGHGHESWHPDPEFYYKTGGGPMFDMGPYYLTALINLIGPVKRVTGSTAVSFPERTITSRPKYGEKIKVEVPTHVAGIIDFENGAIGTLITSFDVWGAQLPRIEIYGSAGSLSVPDPNQFGGQIMIKREGAAEWTAIPYTHRYSEESRGIGVADMAAAIYYGRENRASSRLAYHVLDIMHGFHDASNNGRHYILKSTCSRPSAIPSGLPLNRFDQK